MKKQFYALKNQIFPDYVLEKCSNNTSSMAWSLSFAPL